MNVFVLTRYNNNSLQTQGRLRKTGYILHEAGMVSEVFCYCYDKWAFYPDNCIIYYDKAGYGHLV